MQNGTEQQAGRARAAHTHLGSPAGVRCPRCQRLAAGGFPAHDRCTPHDWVLCGRDPIAIATGGRPFEWVMLFAPVAPIGGSAARSAR